MVELRVKTPCAGLLPLEVGELSLTEAPGEGMTTLAPYAGQVAALSAALEAAHGLRWPAPNRSHAKAGARIIWFGREMALLSGTRPDPALAEHAALTDQSDGWAVVRLEGAQGDAVLARLCPVDLRPSVFKRGHTARCELKHMAASITRLGPKTLQIMVFRSMAETLVDDLKTAMEAVAARG
ncbi:sarcosine oxidase subunit gamma [Phaeobacter inhibens]|uniref:sarcosine oxidase subunit gamma n=1 Tax=Phaeobacter inhibens TaxID=221822 RepID=UPI000489D988|nr:sarcosine oxidase subunit gamma [Phaeobacter inhibens]AUQ61837.1 putative sarcosine oxidase, subunit gamma [Phaeobacter inhibens]AUQ81811.1 putative sarcosine oxidase, subunit gamma [Phaeobacter inhibens]AUQ89534.1 putative sarcosine oxidase, subunit gamma [Phaeobacter inhibens]MDO6757072.1 sarcosine oxidase subunit gamma [Phaeobacter inhibens]UWR40823.1 sarcosine oxidase subunit gamma [Phaeobacter inhibens]